MISTTCSRAGCSAPASLEGMALKQQAKLYIETAVQELKLKMTGELDLITEEQIALREDVKVITNGFADRLIALKNKIKRLERFCATSRSESEISGRFANDLGSLRHDVNQLVKVRFAIGTEVYLHFERVADRPGKVELHMATVPENAQLPNIIISP